MQLNEKERATLEKQAGEGWRKSEVAALLLIAHHLDRLATAAENIATTTQDISGTYDAIAKTLQGVAASEQPDWEARTPPQGLEVDVGCWGGISSPCPGPDPVLYVKPKCAVSPLSDTPVVDPDHYA